MTQWFSFMSVNYKPGTSEYTFHNISSFDMWAQTNRNAAYIGKDLSQVKYTYEFKLWMAPIFGHIQRGT